MMNRNRHMRERVKCLRYNDELVSFKGGRIYGK